MKNRGESHAENSKRQPAPVSKAGNGVAPEPEFSKFFVDGSVSAARQFFESYGSDKNQSANPVAAQILLRDLYQLARKLPSVEGADEILKQGLEMLFNALPSVSRAAVMLDSGPGGKLEARTVKYRDEEPDERVISLDQGILEKVSQDAVAIVTRPGNENCKADEAKSAVIDDINSIICCPMNHTNGVNGVIYLETGNSNQPLTLFERNFAAAVSAQLALSIANDQRQSKMLADIKMSSADHIVSKMADQMTCLLEDNGNALDKLDEQIQDIDRDDVADDWFKIRKSLQKIADITEEMSVYTRIEALDRQEIEVKSVILEEWEAFKKKFASEKIQFDLDLAPNLPSWMINEVGLRRSLRALLFNAGEALQGFDNGCVKISSEVENEDTISIRVTDNGCGISKGCLAKVFELFYTDKGAAHSGIGLATVKRFVESQGGKIAVVSQPEVGSVFSMVFPKT